MASKKIVLWEQSGEFFDLFINDPYEEVSKFPGWIQIDSPDRTSSALRIVSAVNDSGLRRIRIKPTKMAFVKDTSSLLNNGMISRFSDSAPPSSQTIDDATSYNPPPKSSSFEFNPMYALVAVLLLIVGAYFYFKR